MMEGVAEDIVIVGAGIAGLTTALGLHRQGIRSIVLESSDTLRITGFAMTIWTNAWRALDAIGIGDSLREKHVQLLGNVAASTVTGLPTSDFSFMTKGRFGDHEARCVSRKLLLESLENGLPRGTVKYSSKVVSIEEQEDYHKLVHLGDGSTIKAKVLIGCDGLNSVVGKWLGFKRPSFTGRLAIRGYEDFECSHGFEAKFLLFYGKGARFGFIPCDDKTGYWFFTLDQTDQELEENPAKMKQYVLSKLEKVPARVRAVIENSKLDCFVAFPLTYRQPWELVWANISEGNVCVAGDALHPMTPDIRQGGCSALEDGVVLARCLAEAMLREPIAENGKKEEYKRIEMGLKKYAKERRWRSFELITTSYMVGFVQQSDRMVIKFLRDRFLVKFLASLLMKKADFDCGKLFTS